MATLSRRLPLKTKYAFTLSDVEAVLDGMEVEYDFDTFLNKLCAENNSRNITKVLEMVSYLKPLYKMHGYRIGIEQDTAYAPVRIYWR